VEKINRLEIKKKGFFPLLVPILYNYILYREKLSKSREILAIFTFFSGLVLTVDSISSRPCA
jgi:drug/metabolite transporter (DMT)-like permease